MLSTLGVGAAYRRKVAFPFGTARVEHARQARWRFMNNAQNKIYHASGKPVYEGFGEGTGVRTFARVPPRIVCTSQHVGNVVVFVGVPAYVLRALHYFLCRADCHVNASQKYKSIEFADGHTASNAPDLFRPPKLSGAGPG